MNAQERPSVITHTSDVIDNTNTLRGRRASIFNLPNGVHVSRVIFNKDYIDYIIRNEDETELNISAFLDSVRSKVNSIIQYEFNVKLGLKANLQLLIRYVNIIGVYLDFAYKTSSSSLSNDEDLDEFIENLFQTLLADVENRQLQDSGWSLFAVKRLDLKISKHVYLPGRCSIDIPKWITSKRATLPIKNKDNYCFKWSIMTAYLHQLRIKVNLKNMFAHDHVFNFNIKFPPGRKDITKFCTLNKASVHVFGVLNKNFYPIYICKKIRENHFNLLYYENGIMGHYCPIVHLSRLIRSQITKNTRPNFFCIRCFLHFPTQERLDIHVKACGNEKLTTIKLPAGKSYYKFDRQDCVQRNYVICTIDVESFLSKVQSCSPKPDSSFTYDIHRHELAAVSIFCKVLSDTPEAKKIPSGIHTIVYKEEQSIEDELISYFDSLTKAANVFFNKQYPIHYSKADEVEYEKSEVCYACHLPFTNEDIKCHDHCHLTPRNNLRGACHTSCNLKMRVKRMIPILAHNLGKYDGHFFIKMFAKRNFKMYVIPHTIETYLCFDVRYNGVILRFLDSFKFFNSSLQNALDSLPNEYFIETRKVFPEEVHSLIFSKLPFCYTFLSNPESLTCTEIPPKSFFYNDLTEKETSDEEYERAKLLWERLKCKSFSDFMSNYVQADTVQLFDLCHYFRDLIYDNFGLELTNFLSLPHLSITAMLKLSKTQIQVFDDSMQGAYDMIRRSIYGGIVTCNVRYVEAKNDIVLSQYDLNSAYVTILRNLKLPISDYLFVPIDSQDWQSLDTTGIYGYFLEIDCHFPPSTHDYLDQFIPIVERKLPPGAKTERLISDFTDKHNYVLTLQHYQLLIRLGVQITRIWQVLQYKQSNYMAPYIDIVSNWRTKSTNKFANAQFKGMQVYIYGKLISRVVRRSVEIITDERRMQKVVRKGTFLDRYIYEYPTFSMAIVELSKGVVLVNRPIIIGSFVLNMTKVLMYQFWYDVIKVNFDCASLIATDTDSALFSFKSKDPDSIFKKLSQHFDFSNLDPAHPLFSNENKGVLGKFKLETKGKRVLAACCVKSKVYSLLFEDSSCIKKLKGVQKDYVLNKISFSDYVDCVKNSTTRFALFKSIISREHELFTVQKCKLALECTDHKRFLLPDRINTLAFGNYKINNLEN